ncbi:MAG: tetratricopeptide repeat protein [Planctomycetota bacterium]|nr:tetratricopeptide repeat protein [Planctomycetota bacterium]
MKRTVVLLAFLAVMAVFMFAEEVSVEADTVVMKNGLKYHCKVVSDDPDKDHIVVRVTYEDGKTGRLSIQRRNIDKIIYDFESRLARLQDDDYVEMYDLALYALANGMQDKAIALLNGCAGKEGVPSNAWLLLARIHRDSGKFEAAQGYYEKYLEAVPKDTEVKKELEQLKKEIAQQNTEKPPKPTPQQTTTPEISKTPSKTDPNGVSVTLLEGLEANREWLVAPWAGTGDISYRKENDNTILVYNYDPQRYQKSVCYMVFDDGQKVEQSKGFEFSVYNTNKDAVQLSLGLSIGSSATRSQYYESRLKIVPSQKWTDLSYDLTTNKWKTKPKWTYTETLPKESIHAVFLLIYPGSNKGTAYFDKLSFSNGGK